MPNGIVTKARNLAEEYVNMNYLGIVAGILSIVIAGYNINQYFQSERTKRKTP